MQNSSLKRPTFPCQLYELLADSEEKGFATVVTWLPDGKGFIIREPQEFCETVIKKYFNQSKLSSFTRQLYLYGFKKIAEGTFWHPLFVRDNQESCLAIRRKQGVDRRLKDGKKRKSYTKRSSALLPSLKSTPYTQVQQKCRFSVGKKVLSGLHYEALDTISGNGLSFGDLFCIVDDLEPTPIEEIMKRPSNLYATYQFLLHGRAEK